MDGPNAFSSSIIEGPHMWAPFLFPSSTALFYNLPMHLRVVTLYFLLTISWGIEPIYAEHTGGTAAPTQTASIRKESVIACFQSLKDAQFDLGIYTVDPNGVVGIPSLLREKEVLFLSAQSGGYTGSLPQRPKWQFDANRVPIERSGNNPAFDVYKVKYEIDGNPLYGAFDRSRSNAMLSRFSRLVRQDLVGGHSDLDLKPMAPESLLPEFVRFLTGRFSEVVELQRRANASMEKRLSDAEGKKLNLSGREVLAARRKAIELCLRLIPKAEADEYRRSLAEVDAQTPNLLKWLSEG